MQIGFERNDRQQSTTDELINLIAIDKTVQFVGCCLRQCRAPYPDRVLGDTSFPLHRQAEDGIR